MKKCNYNVRRLFTMILIFLSAGLYAQWDDGLWTGGQANNWYFGYNQGLAFASGTPQLLPGGQTAVMEGTAVMSDDAGQLLFYASNGTVWNKNHMVMLNGDNILAGDQSSTQDGIIVPKPGSAGIYYLFNEDIFDGLVYSEIDMALDGGLGGVTATKNVVLDATAKAEKLTAIYHADKEQIWVVSHRGGNNEFIAYLISASGVAETPVVSAVGFSYTTVAPVQNYTYISNGPGGQLKASPDGSKLAAVQPMGILNGGSFINGTIEVLNFDNTTGEVSDPVSLQIAHEAYGLEFSPNSKFLYVLDNLYLPTSGFLGTTIEKVFQYDVTAGNQAAVAASVIQVGQYNSRFETAMQVAPDGRIYMVNSASLNTLVAIKNPNNAGTACGFQTGFLTMNDSDTLGLPAFNQSYFQSGIQYTENCGNEVYFNALRIPDITLTAWNFGDPASGADNTSFLAHHVFSAPGTYTVTVDITSNGAIQTVTFDVLVTGGGIAFTPPQDVSKCINSGTTAVFDLTAQQVAIMAGLDMNQYTIGYYESRANAEAGTNAISNPASFTSAGQTIYVRITNTATACHTITQFEIHATPAPIAPTVSNLQLCGTNGSAIFDLTVQNTALLQGNTGATIVYFKSQANADANTNAIANATSFTNTANPQTVYARINSGNCYAVTTFNLEVTPAPVVTQVPDLQLCSTNDSAIFDLTAQNAALLQGNTGATIAYFTSQANADANTNAIANTTNFTNTANPQTVYARISLGNCYAVTTFNLEVTPAPVAAQVPDLQLCGTNGSAIFDLTAQNAALLQGNTGATIAYFTSQANADANTNAIANATSFTNTANPQTVYARITSGNCYAVTTFNLEVTPAPVATQAPDLQLCGTNGSATFDLTTQNIALLQGNTGATIAYFTSQANADANTNAIANATSFTNTANPQTVYARITSGNCYAVSTFNLEVTPAPVVTQVPDLQLCGTNGSAVFDLTTQNIALLQGNTGATIAYFTSQANADANANAIANTTNFTNTANPQTVHARITLGNCYAVSTFDVEVNEAPLLITSFSITGCFPFNLGSAITGIPADIQLSYYTSKSDAENAANALANTSTYTFTGTASTVYVRAENTAGCISIASIDINKGDCDIPRGISPNDDTLNDNFDLSFLEVRKLVIYNRYGLEVYSRNNYKNEWYGQSDSKDELPTGTYFYVIEPESGQSKTGWVYINRQTN